jgi:hypothetical protein
MARVDETPPHWQSIGMERKANGGESQAPSLLEEVFAVTSGNGDGDSTRQTQAVQKLHARLASPEFSARMTGIFFEAKRAALADSK